MSARIIIYLLRHKFVNQRQDIPETARQIVYYTIAVGHHVGVMDCFSSLAEIPLEEFQAWLESLPGGPGRSKLEGVMKWGEIEINRAHVSLLAPLLEKQASIVAHPDSSVMAGEQNQPAESAQQQTESTWQALLLQCLRDMQQEPALYVMMRKQA